MIQALRSYRIVGERKNKNIVADDPAKRKVVKRIFREFVDGGWSMSAIASRLNADGVPSPGERGKPWRFDAVKVILENVAYIGTFRFNVESRAKYNSFSNGEIQPGKSSGTKLSTDWIVIEDHHEALIDRATFDKAQAILAKGKTGRSNKYTPENNPYRLAGILRCGRCGSPLWGVECRGKFVYYECSKQKYKGKDSCEGCTVREDKVLLKIAGDLAEWWGLECADISPAFFGKMSNDTELPKAFAEIRKLLVPTVQPKKDRDRLTKEAAQLTARLTKTRANLVELDRENIPAAQERIRQLADRLAEIEMELRETAPPAEKDINVAVREVVHRVYGLINCFKLMATVPDSLRSVFRIADEEKTVRAFLRSVERIDIDTEKMGCGTGTRHVITAGRIVLKQVGVVTSNSNRHLLG